jgi:hypothetical protein
MRRYAWGMPRREDDDVARRTAAPTMRTLVQAGGFALAVLATLAVFLTENAQYLRIAVVAVAWAFVLATFAAGRRDTDRVAAAAREADLRHAYELELDREVAARREYELELENELRRETEDAMRYELDALRGDIAALSGLRDEVARVSELRGDIAALTSLREEVARVAALREDVAALNSLREELGQLAELRADMGRLRAELTEQLSSEMLVERIVMRTQASRLTGEPARLDGGTWSGESAPRELTGGWPAVRLDEPRETRTFEQVHPDGQRQVPETVSWAIPTWESATREAPAAGSTPWDAPLPSWETPGTYARLATPSPTFPPAPPRHAVGEHPPAPATTAFPIAPSSIARPPVAEPPPSPLDWLAARSLLDEPQPRTSMPAVPPRRRSTDLPVAPEPDLDARTEQRPVARPEPATAGTRVAEILAENGVTPPSGGRRRRRYRDEDQTDDVLARVLGRN